MPAKRSFARKTYAQDHVRTLAIRAANAAPDHIRCRRRLGPNAKLPGDISCRFVAYQNGTDRERPGIEVREGSFVTYEWLYECEGAPFQNLSGKLQKRSGTGHCIARTLPPPLAISNLAVVSYLLANLPGKTPWLQEAGLEMLAVAAPDPLKEAPQLIQIWKPDVGEAGARITYVLLAEVSETWKEIASRKRQTGIAIRAWKFDMRWLRGCCG